MSGDWALIIRGFVIASVGTASTILYIVAISAAYVGRFSISAASAATGAVLGVAFLRAMGPYLDAIDRREIAESSQMKPQAGNREP
jgi:hypothetical protein